MHRALWVGGFFGLVGPILLGCSSSSANGASPDGGGGGGSSSGGGTTSSGGAGSSGGSASGGGTVSGAQSLIGTWDLLLAAPMMMPTANGGPGVTITVGQNSLAVASPGFTLMATRTGNALTFADDEEPGNGGSDVALTATQTAASFNAGILPFDLGGSWAMKIVPTGGATVMTCTLAVSSTEIDGSCNKITDGFTFSFTTTKMTSAASMLGDFGGTWMNTWTWPGMGGGTYPCQLEFTGNSITTCPLGPTNGSPLTGITFTYDGAGVASGVAAGSAEYSVTRR